jgi:hypothetical protein
VGHGAGLDLRVVRGNLPVPPTPLHLAAPRTRGSAAGL